MHKIDDKIEGEINDVMIELSDLADEDIAESNPILFDMKLRDIHSRAGQNGVASSFDVLRAAYDAAKANPVRRPEPVEDEKTDGSVGGIDRAPSPFWQNRADDKRSDQLSGNFDGPSGGGETSGQTSKKLSQPGAEDAAEIAGAQSDDSASTTRGDGDAGEVKPSHFVVE